MTYAEYELGYYMGDSEDYSGPPEDPETQAMLEHLIEYETEMFKQIRQDAASLRWRWSPRTA